MDFLKTKANNEFAAGKPKKSKAFQKYDMIKMLK